MTAWLAIIPFEIARSERDGGYAQLGHGMYAVVSSLKKDDWIVYYSPRERLGDGDSVEALTAIGRVMSKWPYKVRRPTAISVYRVKVNVIEEARQVLFAPSANQLQLIQRYELIWKLVVRGGLHEISIANLRIIAKAMRAKLDTHGSQAGS